MKKCKFKPGDRVRFASAWCKSIQADGEIASMTGTVVSVKLPDNPTCKVALVKVIWDGESDPRGSLDKNLERA